MVPATDERRGAASKLWPPHPLAAPPGELRLLEEGNVIFILGSHMGYGPMDIGR